MSDFDLVPVDGGAAVHLPSGETVLGRGPLLGTHVNPCFVQSSITDEPRPLTRNSWCPLQDGDLFSLLPGHLIYKVVSVGGVTGTRRYSHHVRIKKRLKSLSNKSWCQRKTEWLLFNSGLTFYLFDDAVVTVPNVMRRRVLPAWMMAIAPTQTSALPHKGIIPTCVGHMPMFYLFVTSL
uniref:PNK FHA domain-containing protein n=1 Tax=Cynoglossus semilaevis TaxID=244447 RepID=A0A3P8UH92_CYNSE